MFLDQLSSQNNTPPPGNKSSITTLLRPLLDFFFSRIRVRCVVMAAACDGASEGQNQMNADAIARSNTASARLGMDFQCPHL